MHTQAIGVESGLSMPCEKQELLQQAGDKIGKVKQFP